MSEQWTPTTDQVRSFYAHDSEDEYHDPIAYPSHVRSAEQAFDRWLAQVQREAAVKALRDAAQDSQMGPVPYGWNASGIASWLRDRAEQIEGGANHA